MPTLNIQWDVEINTDQLKDYLVHLERFQPVVFGFTAKHAEFMEFGTGPQSISPRSTHRHPMGEEGIKAIEEWVRKKLGVSNATERKRITNSIVWNIRKNGLKPRPFFRPAYMRVADQMQRYYDEGYTFMEMANEIHAIALDNIMALGLPYDGTLQRSSSWSVEKLTPDEADRKANVGAIDVHSVLESGAFQW